MMHGHTYIKLYITLYTISTLYLHWIADVQLAASDLLENMCVLLQVP